ncbi:MAG: glycosyltransferase family 4 protein [Acidobacteriota bacterium]
MADPRQAIRVAMVTNIPAPYRIPVYERLAADPDLDLHLVYCSGAEPDRAWQLQGGQFAKVFLKERFWTVKGRFIHFNPDVWTALRRIRPQVVVTTGYNPTHLLAFLYAGLHGAAHVVMTDGTQVSEAGYSWAHRLVRRVVFAGSAAFVGASQGAMALFAQYGVPAGRTFKSHLCADNVLYERAAVVPKRYDLLFSGRMVGIKNPFFVLDVARALAARLKRRVSVAFLGSGDLQPELKARAEALASELEVSFPGFIQQADLPDYYGAARVFLFPTSWDPWGVVANEACAAGVPVLVTPQAGVSGDLIVDGDNGWILPLDVSTWAQRCEQLLTDPDLYARLSRQARQRVQPFNFDAAASGLKAAVCLAVRGDQAPGGKGGAR